MEGIKEQLENNKDTYETLTLDKFQTFIKDLEKDIKQSNDIVIGTGCLTNGFIMRSASNLNICDNPNCTNCREMEEILKKEIKPNSNSTYSEKMKQIMKDRGRFNKIKK